MEKYLGAEINYDDFIKELDTRLESYFKLFGRHIKCQKGCSECCEKGDYPLTDIEFAYLMQGYMALKPDIKIQVQNNIKTMKKGGVCPFLTNHECSIYANRPIICRTHGLAYFYKEREVKIPHCVENGKNFADVYKNGEFNIQPINANLDTYHILEGHFSEIKNLYDWLNSDNDSLKNSAELLSF